MHVSKCKYLMRLHFKLIMFLHGHTNKLHTVRHTKLGRYHDIIEYRDISLDTISISDGFGFNRNIDISRYIAIIPIYRNIN